MNKQTKYITTLLLALSVVLIYFIIIKTTFNNKTDSFITAVYKTNTGYGYSISYNNKLLIKQDYIPAIQNNLSFCNFQDAQRVANLVKEKLSNKENPKISLSELKQLHIKLNCIN